MKVNSAHSIWKDKFYGIPQGFMLGPSYVICFISQKTLALQVMQ